jgi:hypothetical protein
MATDGRRPNAWRLFAGRPRAVAAGAVALSVVAGLILALGGLARRPELWIAIPPLVLIRFALNAIPRRVRLSPRALYPVPVEEAEVDLPEPATIEDGMLHAIGR